MGNGQIHRLIMPLAVTPKKQAGQLKATGVVLVCSPSGSVAPIYYHHRYLCSCMARRFQECCPIYWRCSTQGSYLERPELLVFSGLFHSSVHRFGRNYSMPLFDAWLLEPELVCQCQSRILLYIIACSYDVLCKVILIPTWVGQVCLLLGDSLTVSERSGCSRTIGRAYATFQTGINGVKAITGANTLDIASLGIDLGLSTLNNTLVSEAYGIVHSELSIKDGLKADGIRADGSFGKFRLQ